MQLAIGRLAPNLIDHDARPECRDEQRDHCAGQHQPTADAPKRAPENLSHCASLSTLFMCLHNAKVW